MTRAPSRLSVAFVHHANQLAITDGYQNREGIYDVLGTRWGTGLRRILEIHRRYRVPVNLHLSGTLLEAIEWESPEFFSELRELSDLGLLEMIGSSYGQNILPLFPKEYNSKQLREHLRLYSELLGWKPREVKTFWVPERVWETQTISPLLRNNSDLPNGGYDYVLLDDRLLYPSLGEDGPRRKYDREGGWDPANFRVYRVEGGHGLKVIPISRDLRLNIPPILPGSSDMVRALLRWLVDVNGDCEGDAIALFADDMEKSAGVGPWNREGASSYEETIRWVSEEAAWLDPVKIADWARGKEAVGERRIDRGAFVELVNWFEAGEDYRWSRDPSYLAYREYQEWSERRVGELEKDGADAALLELAWKTLLATSWETGWQTPRTGVHGDPKTSGGPSPWIRAIMSHSRVSAIIADAAHWAAHADGSSHASLLDVDLDRREELIVKNEELYAVFSPSEGGRLVYLFSLEKPGKLLVGNPIDDWNWQEELHAYMDLPPNHPGAFADVGYEHQGFIPKVTEQGGGRASARLVAKGSSREIQKEITLEAGGEVIAVEYSIDPGRRFSTEVGVSPDYQWLLNHSRSEVTESTRGRRKEWSNGMVTVWVDATGAEWGKPRQPTFGHGFLVRARAFQERFSFALGVERS